MNQVANYRPAISSAKEGFLSQFEDRDEGVRVFTKEAGFAVIQIKANRQLQSATPESLTSAVVSVALTGISLNPTLGLAYLVPIREGASVVAQLRISYKGMIEILINSGSVKNISASAIYEGDRYDYQLGTDAYLNHVPALNRPDDARIIAAYAIAETETGTRIPFIMDWKAIKKRRDVAKTKAVWDKWEEEMAIKTVIRSMYKYLPKTPQANESMRIFDEQVNVEDVTGRQESDISSKAAIALADEVMLDVELSSDDKLSKIRELREKYLTSGSDFRAHTASLIDSIIDEIEIRVDVSEDKD